MKKQNTQLLDAQTFMAAEKPTRVPETVKAEAVKLLEAGYSLAQAQRFLTRNGFSASKSTISAWPTGKGSK
jgi:hypothetical protein